MKKLFLVLALLVAGWLVYNQQTTGEWSLMPGAKPSAAEQELRQIETDLAALRKQIGQAHRTASIGGVDTTADVEAARRAVEGLGDSLERVRPQLVTDRARERAARLAGEIEAFERELR